MYSWFRLRFCRTTAFGDPADAIFNEILIRAPVSQTILRRPPELPDLTGLCPSTIPNRNRWHETTKMRPEILRQASAWHVITPTLGTRTVPASRRRRTYPSPSSRLSSQLTNRSAAIYSLFRNYVPAERPPCCPSRKRSGIPLNDHS